MIAATVCFLMAAALILALVARHQRVLREIAEEELDEVAFDVLFLRRMYHEAMEYVDRLEAELVAAGMDGEAGPVVIPPDAN